jgi:hypothetical protein
LLAALAAMIEEENVRTRSYGYGSVSSKDTTREELTQRSKDNTAKTTKKMLSVIVTIQRALWG